MCGPGCWLLAGGCPVSAAPLLPPELEPSPKSDEAIIVIEEAIDHNAVTNKDQEEKDEDIPQPAQAADIARPSSNTEEKVRTGSQGGTVGRQH